ncbi:SusF/SusE family outer membrane protein [Parabacteroides sp. PF5-9]|uniref:SusF/SusE family outer membrane protein n=1 Tax=Parabacteroides sp. PF5-9 TaxID=1742404 RepID=UPI00247631FA|nr:SusF/SusE family outer membrane protein [Parabacteroides sp. PF5-9]MDH6359282.1 hypothetical protein [Parabacteroides sp. PF5-9]
MKKYNIFLILTALLCIMGACNDDRDSNPTLQQPTSFVLNTPAYVNNVYDLKQTQTIELTTSQPDYGFTAATTYQVQMALSDNFNDEATSVWLSTTYTSARMNISASEIARALVGLLQAESEDDFPKEPIPLYFRLKASLSAGLGEVYSNSITLPNVLGYYAMEELTMPENMYMIGSINDWNWDASFEMVPVHSNPGKFWRVVYLPTDAEIKFNYVQQWNGSEFGYEEDRFPASSVSYANLSDSGGNIKVGKGGWYIVVVSTALQGQNYLYTVEFLVPDVYLTGNTAGGWDFFDETNKFTVPVDGEGEFVSPAFVASDELRMSIKLADIDWWKTEFIILGGKIVYRAGGDDQERVNVTTGQKAYLNFTTGEGAVK